VAHVADAVIEARISSSQLFEDNLFAVLGLFKEVLHMAQQDASSTRRARQDASSTRRQLHIFGVTGCKF
jgi:hypothetical protein